MADADQDPAPARDQATLDFYDKEARVYATHGKGLASRGLDEFAALLPAGARVLELGCGGGRDAAALLAKGFDVDATDGSSAMAAMAAERLGRPVSVMRFDELDAIAVYDGVWANASLLHVPRAALVGVLARIRRALKPGGLHFASYKLGEEGGRDHLGRYYNYFDRETLLATYAEAGEWDMHLAEDYVDGGYDSVRRPWLAVMARRPPDDPDW